MRTIGRFGKVFVFAALFLIISSSSYAASRAATEFVNDFQLLLDKRDPSIKVKLIKDEPYNLLGFRKVVVMIKSTRRVYLTNGKLIIPALFSVKDGHNLLKRNETVRNKVPLSNFSYGEYNRILGKKDAKIKIIMFSDYECMYCKRLWPYLVNLPEKYDVAIYDKHFVVHKKGMIVAEIYEAVRIATGKKLSGYLFKHRKFSDSENNKNIINGILKDNDLEKQSKRIRNLIKSKEVKEIIDKDIAEGKKFNVRGTPTLFIDGYRVVGVDKSSIETILKRESR